MSEFDDLKSWKYLSPKNSDEFDNLFWEAHGGEHSTKHDNMFSKDTFEALCEWEEVMPNPHDIYNNTLYKRDLNSFFYKHGIQWEFSLHKMNELVQKVLSWFDAICLDMRQTFAYQEYPKLTKTVKWKLQIAKKGVYAWKGLSKEKKYIYFSQQYEKHSESFVPEQKQTLDKAYDDMREVLVLLRKSI